MTENHLPSAGLQEHSSAPLKKNSRFRFSPTSYGIRKTLIIVVGILLMTALFIVSIIPVQYDMPIGDPASESVYAYKDWEDVEKTEQLRDEAESKVGKVYNEVPEASERIKQRINNVYAVLNQINQHAVTIAAEHDSDHSTYEYSSEEISEARQYITVDFETELADSQALLDLPNEAILCIMRSDEEQLLSLNHYLLSLFPDDKPYTLKTEDIDSFITGGTSTLDTENEVPYPMEISDLVTSVGPSILHACIEPGNIEDHEAYEKKVSEARDEVKPQIIRQGEEVVRKGVTVTAEQHQILEKMGLLTDGTKVDPTIYIGGALLVIAILLSAVFLIFIITPNQSTDLSKLLLAAITVVVDFSFCILARLINVYTAPILMCALILTSMVSMRSGIVMNIVLSIIFSSLTAGGSESFSQHMIIIMVTNILGGTVACMIMKGTSTRIRALICIPVVAAIHAIICLSFNMMTSSNLSTSLEDIGFLCVSTVLSVLLFMALQPIFESIFNMPTTTKLLDLSNPNHPLMKRLMMEAPGTYHHSLMVANLAEASADAIGANSLLARVGGYYHDIGKLKRPLFFSENQVGEENAHDHTDPQVSAAILTAHPVDGVSIAKAYRLPKAIQQIIASHHGNSPVMYFYGKALKQAEGKEVDINNFRYNASLPSTREGAIIMLCDTVEAAVRSMKNPSPEEIDAFVSKLFRGKIDDNQLNDSPLTLQDIEKIRKTCVMQMTGVYHERVAYPDLPKKNEVKSAAVLPDSSAKPAAIKPAQVPESAKKITPIHQPVSPVPEKPQTEQAPASVPLSSVSPVHAPASSAASPVAADPQHASSSEIAKTIAEGSKAAPVSDVKYVEPTVVAPIPKVDIPKPFIPSVSLDDLLNGTTESTSASQGSPAVSPEKSNDPSISAESRDE